MKCHTSEAVAEVLSFKLRTTNLNMGDCTRVLLADDIIDVVVGPTPGTAGMSAFTYEETPDCSFVERLGRLLS